MLVDFDILTVIIGLIIFIIVALILKLKLKKENIYLLFCFIMFVYIINVVRLTLFPFPIFSESYEPNLFENVNLVPFSNILTRESLLNIVMMIPLGFGLPFVSKINNWKKMLSAALLSGFIIESLQFMIGAVFSRGFTFRFIDIDDAICNFTGTIIGFCALKLFSRFFLKRLKHRTSGLNQFWNYIFSVADSH